MTKRLLWWVVILTFLAILLFIAALFLTPSFTRVCSETLLSCLDETYDTVWYQRLWLALHCTLQNVCCVLKGLFV